MIKHILLKVYQIWHRLCLNIRYWKETKTLISETCKQLSLPDLPKGKYLILIPHSDDEWIGNSTLISNNKYQVVLFDLDMPGGDTLSLHQERFVEMKAMANCNSRTLYSNKEGDCLIEIIKSYNPDFVTVPYFFDWHPEHRMVMSVLRDLGTTNCHFKVVMYQVTVPIASCNITHINPMEIEEHKHKWRLFKKTYRTQASFPSYRVACQEKINGKMAGIYACEVFCVMSYREWRDNYNKMIPSEDEIDDIKKSLASIKSIRDCKQNHIKWEINSIQ